ncbi:MAG: hypothetical protein J7J31_07720 [Helicobacteraceae bacterium]|nr:hypothetical protein [Helicobacteraceae bacterium]
MKKLFLIFLLCLFSTSSLHANADIYLATGVLTDKDSTDEARDALQEDLIDSNPEIYESQSFKSAYNTTSGFWDFIEGAAQLFDQNGWSIYWNSFITLTHSRLTQHYIDYYSGVSKNHGADLSLQKEAYKASINAGNQVIVIAHSQGNFFTNEVYDSLSPCEQRSFYMLGTANPADHVSGMDEGRGALATLDNDPITFVPSSMSANIINSERFNVAGLDMAHYKFHFFEYYRNQNSVSKYKIDSFPEYAIEHFKEHYTPPPIPNSGVVEISLKWDNEEVDLDLNVGWDAGSVDVKDTCKPFEHFHIRSEATIYPGTFGVSIMPKDSSAEIFDDPSIYPLTVELVTRTPGASDSMLFTIKSKSDINLGHVSNIKVYREDEEDDDTDDEEEDGGDATGGSSAFFIAPSVAPNCPPVNHTPSPTPPKAIVFSSGSSGGYSFSGGGGGSGGYSGSGGGYSGGSGYAAQSDPRCSGDIECIGGATDFHNNSNATGQTQMQAPFSPKVGGEPVRDIVEEDSCEGGLSCKCIPCEYEIIPLKKQANYGPIRGADFSIYTLDGYRTQSSIYDGVTSYGETLYDAGEVDIPQGILETLEDEIFYVIKVQGGEDIDRDDDFTIDTIPTQNLGKAYALIKGEDIKNTGFKINILTTVAFTLLEDMIQKDATAQQLEEKIKEIASRLLRYKIYPQSEELNISNEDLIAWLPAIDKDLLLQFYEPLDAMVEKIYANESIYEEAYEYVYLKSSDDNSTQTVVDEYKPPIIKTFVSSIPEDAVGGTILGSIEILRGSEDLTFASLSGKGSELFTIDASGEIKLKEDAKLDYETKWLYKLKAEAINKNGSSGKVGVYISVKDIVDAPIFVSYEAQKISEDAKPGDTVGKITFDKGAAPIAAIEMQGESTDLFDITIDGTITVAQGASFDYESKYSYGFVVIAKNSYGNSMPAIVYINIDDVADSPKVTDYKGGYIHEDATSGSVVGEVIFDKGGAEIDSITLEGAGSQNFSIDIDGIVRVAPNAALDYESYNFYILTVHLSNTYGMASQNIFISVIDTLDVPSFVSFSGGNVKENAAVNTVVGQIVFDTGSVPIESVSLLGDSSGAFKILDNGTILVAKNILDYEQKNHYVLQATATNAFGSSQVVEVHIFVDDILERAVVLDDFVVNDIAENVAIETILGNIEILDNGSGAIYEYEIIGDKKEYFHVDAQGVVRTAKTLNFETDPEYKLKVKARNEAGWSYGVNLIVRLKDVVDEKPSFSASSIYFDVFENDDSIGKIDFHAGDSPVTSLTLSGTGSEKLSLDPSGDLRVKAGNILDYDRGQRYFGLSVTATNTAGSSSIPIEINVLNIQDIPEIYDVNLSTVFANITVDSIIGQINFHTGDSPLTHVELNGDDAHYFDVDTNGTIRIKTVLESFELKKTYDFTVAFVNSSGESLPKDIKVELLGQGELPIINNFQATVNENLVAGSIVGQIEVVSHGDAPIDGYHLEDTSQFVIDANGTIKVAPLAVLDYEKQHFIHLMVQASNVVGLSDPKYLHISLNNLIDTPPTLRDLNISINKEIAIGSIIGNLLLDKGDGIITEFSFSNSPFFTLEKNGNIKVSNSLLEQDDTHFELHATLTNSFGISNEAIVRITLITTPVLDDSSLKAFDNSTALIQIGKLPIIKNGNDIQSISLSGDGSSDFTVETDGVIRVAQGVTLQASRQDYYDLTVLINEMYEATLTINVHHRIIGSFDTPDTAWSVTLSADGTKAYVADGGSGLQIIDVGDPTAPTKLGSFDTSDYANGVTLSADGTKAYVADGWSGFQIIDVSDPTAPTRIGSFNTPGYALDVTLSADGIKAYVADGGSGLQIIDITDPTALITLGSFDTSGYANGVTFSADGTKAYVTDGGSGLQVIDVSDPTAPIRLGSFDTPNNVYGVTLSADGTKAYVADYNSGLQIIDITDSTTPTRLGSFNTPGYALDVTLSADGTKAYVADDSSGLQIIDITDPITPILLASINTPNYAWGVTLSADGTKAYVADRNSGLQIIDVSGFNVEQKVPSIKGFSSVIEASLVEGSFIGAVKIYYTGESGITSFRLDGERAEDFSIDQEGRISLAKQLEARADNIYTLKAIATNSIGERETDVTIRVHSIPEIKPFSKTINSMTPPDTLVGKLEMLVDDNTTISYIALSGEGSEYFYINSSGEIYVSEEAELHHFVKADYELEVTAINSYGSNDFPISINIKALVASFDTSRAQYVTLSADGTKAYVADYNSGLQIIDITDPATPTHLGSIDTPSYAYGVTLSADGTKAYVADGGSGLQIIDITDSTAPTRLGSFDTPGSTQDVTLSADGTTAYVADYNSGLQIIDIIDPATPTHLGSFGTPSYAQSVTLSADGTKAYVADSWSGFQIIDVNDPTAPIHLGSFDTPGSAVDVTLSADGTKAYVADYQSGVHIIDITDPTSPTRLGSFDTPGYAQDVTLSADGTKAYVAHGTKAYVANSYSGVQIIDITNPTAPTKLGSFDTPSNAQDVTLSADGTKAYVADHQSGLQIIDLTGLN